MYKNKFMDLIINNNQFIQNLIYVKNIKNMQFVYKHANFFVRVVVLDYNPFCY